MIADPEQRLSVRSQVALLDEAAIALKDDRLGFTLAREFDPRELGLLRTRSRRCFLMEECSCRMLLAILE